MSAFGGEADIGEFPEISNFCPEELEIITSV